MVEQIVQRFFFRHPEEAAIQSEVRRIANKLFLENYGEQHRLYSAGEIDALSSTPVLDGVNSHDTGVQVFRVYTLLSSEDGIAKRIDRATQERKLVRADPGKVPYECAFKYGIRRITNLGDIKELSELDNVQGIASELILIAGLISKEDAESIRTSLRGSLSKYENVIARHGYFIKEMSPIPFLVSLVNGTVKKIGVSRIPEGIVA